MATTEVKMNDAYLKDERPRHIFYRHTYIDGVKRAVPYLTERIEKRLLKAGDIIVKRHWWETEEVESLHKVIRINKQSITVKDCDQYGYTAPYEREDNKKELMKGDKFNLIYSLDYNKPAPKEVVLTDELKAIIIKYNKAYTLMKLFEDGLTTDESGASKRDKALAEFYDLMKQLYDLDCSEGYASEAYKHFTEWKKVVRQEQRQKDADEDRA